MNERDFDRQLDPLATWEEMFEELSSYKEQFGSILISKIIDEELGAWTAELRKLYAAGDLDSEWVVKPKISGLQKHRRKSLYRGDSLSENGISLL